MDKNRRIQPRVTRRFLQLAAVAFALGAEAAPPAMTEAAVATRPARAAEAGGDVARTKAEDEGEGAAMAATYRHVFELHAAGASLPQAPDRAQVRVIDHAGRNRIHLAVQGASMIGPLPPGAYTVLVKSAGLTEVHRVQVASVEQGWLHFTEAA